MCRTGGRRCETHWTPEQKAADNARRRAIYAAKTAALGESVLTQEKLHLLMNEQRSVNTNATADQQTSASVDMESITDQSYLDYGFENPGDLSDYKQSFDDDELTEEVIADSNDKELPALNYRERAALSVFASRSYSTINTYLHGVPTAEKIQRTGLADRFDHSINSEDEYLKERDDDDAESRSEEYIVNRSIRDTCRSFYYHEMITATNLQDYVSTVDSAFSKASGVERTLYRGESFGKEHHEGTLKEYIDTHMKLGSKVKFKGLQSTSLKEKAAKDFGCVGKYDGIVYEIKSPSGINISGVSPYPGESEVLLPRNTQYRVVGVHYMGGRNNFTGENINTAVIQLVEVDDNDNVRTKDNLRTEFGEFDVNKFVKKEGV